MASLSDGLREDLDGADLRAAGPPRRAFCLGARVGHAGRPRRTACARDDWRRLPHSQLLERSLSFGGVRGRGKSTQAVAHLLSDDDLYRHTTHGRADRRHLDSTRVFVRVDVYEGGRRSAATQAARHNRRHAQQLVAWRRRSALRAGTAYVEVWEAQQVVSVRQSNVRVLTQQLRAARDRFEVGEDTRTDVAQARAQLAQARSALAAAEGSLEISRELFNLAVGRYPNGLAGPEGAAASAGQRGEAVDLRGRETPRQSGRCNPRCGPPSSPSRKRAAPRARPCRSN